MTEEARAEKGTPAVRITGIGSDGAGVGHLPDGRVVFVPRTAPGDLAVVRLTREKARWARGEVLALQEEGAARRPAPCPFYDRCGGCSIQHLEPSAQREAKFTRVVETLRRIGGETEIPDPEWGDGEAGPEFHYRNRMTFHLLRLPGGGVRAGLYHRSSPGRIVEVDGRCLLPEKPITVAWDALRAGWGEDARWLPGGRELRLTLRGLSSGEVILLIEGGRGAGSPEALREASGLAAVWVRGEGEIRPVLAAGRGDLDEAWFGEEFAITPGTFSQVNRSRAEALHQWVIETTAPRTGDRVLDAYCGFGTYGRAFAREGFTAIGIEMDPGAVSTAARRPVSGFTLVEGKVEERIGAALPVERVILNPPRGGVAPGVMEALREASPARIVYVSCDPATLARDQALLGGDYTVASIRLFDLFPQTSHVETVMTMDLRGAQSEPERGE